MISTICSVFSGLLAIIIITISVGLRVLAIFLTNKNPTIDDFIGSGKDWYDSE